MFYRENIKVYFYFYIIIETQDTEEKLFSHLNIKMLIQRLSDFQFQESLF